MTLVFTEFETTPADFYTSVRNALVAGGDWADISPTPLTFTYTSATATNNANFAVSSTAGLVVGQVIVAEPGTAREERRTINTVTSGTAGTVNSNWSFVHASGSTFVTESLVLQATTSRGVKMIVDLRANPSSNHYMAGSFYRDFGASVSSWTDRSDWWLYWKASSGTAAMPLHVTLSASTEHLFLAVEGPRAHEASPVSTQYGSGRQYIFMCDLVPYHAGDTVAAIVAGAPTNLNAATPSYTNNSHQVVISRNAANNTSWATGRLGTIAFATAANTDMYPLQRNCTIDGNTYLWPYVVVDNNEGPRGRLALLYNAGLTDVTYPGDYPDPVATQVTYAGRTFKLFAINKGDGTNNAWGPLGAATQGTAVRRSVVVAIPVS